MRSLINGLLFQGVWYTTMILASGGDELLATVPGAIFTIYLSQLRSQEKTSFYPLLWLALGLILGFICELALIRGGLLIPISPPLFWIPLWLLTLWTSLSLLLPLELTWLLKSTLWCVLCGSLSAPLSYLSGAHLGAMTLGASPIQLIIYTSALWAFAMYTVSLIYQRVSLHK